MNTKQDMVEVRIQAAERVEYWQTVLMPRATFERLNAALDGNSEQARAAENEIACAWVKPSDICGSNDFELETFELAKSDG